MTILGAGKGTRTLKLARRNLNPVCLPISSYPHIQFSHERRNCKTFPEVTSPKSVESANSTTPAYSVVPLFLLGEVTRGGAYRLIHFYKNRQYLLLENKLRLLARRPHYEVNLFYIGNIYTGKLLVKLF